MKNDKLAQKREEEYWHLIRDRSIDEDVKASARAAVSTVREPMLEIGDRDWTLYWLQNYIQREHAKYAAETPDDHPYAGHGVRGTPLCTCTSSRCKLKNGEVPTDVRTAETLERGILDFDREHTGDAVVLTESLSARKERISRVLDVFEVAVVALQHGIPVLEVDGAEDVLPEDHDILYPGETEPDGGLMA